MTDETVVPEPKGRFTTKRILLGIGGAVLLATVAGTVVVIVRGGAVHDAWCARFGLFCDKSMTIVAKTRPNGCPSAKMTGAIEAQPTGEAAWTVAADVTGHVDLRRQGTGATGQSSVACDSQRFLASFTDMSDGVTYQCMGTIADQHYDGVCARSAGASALIAGAFVD